jgi:hypothetical protein
MGPLPAHSRMACCHASPRNFGPGPQFFKPTAYGRFEFTFDKVLLTLLPRPCSTRIATTAISARINAYSTRLWPLRDFSPRYIFRIVLMISVIRLILPSTSYPVTGRAVRSIPPLMTYFVNFHCNSQPASWPLAARSRHLSPIVLLPLFRRHTYTIEQLPNMAADLCPAKSVRMLLVVVTTMVTSP